MKMKLLPYKIYQVGYCTHFECMALRGAPCRLKSFPDLCCLIKHPNRGYILFDTGYSHRFFSATKSWPFCIYNKITPVNLSQDDLLIEQLKKEGISPDEINTIIVSHFHADHIGSIKDFPKATFICSKTGYNAVKNQKGVMALKKGFLSDLLPDDFEIRTNYVENFPEVTMQEQFAPFQNAYDLFGDKTVYGILLPGHARGQLGVLFNIESNNPTFLVSDSCWSTKAYRNNILPSILTYFLQDNWSEYKNTLKKIHILSKLNSKVKIIPSHCSEVILTEHTKFSNLEDTIDLRSNDVK